jgi:uncharacterized protein YcbK (DUF882 family)
MPMELIAQADGITRARFTRRGFLKLGAFAAATALASPALASVAPHPMSPEKHISFYNLHTGEDLRALYWERGTYLPDALQEINYILRDFRTGEIIDIDAGLLDLLWSLGRKVGMNPARAFHVVSGYRSPETNEMLRRHNRGVAKNSLHMAGKAADIRVPGYSLAALRKAALELRAGGVGYYPSSRFLHVDTGPVRLW